MRKTYLIHGRIVDGVHDTAIEDGILIFKTDLQAQQGGNKDELLFVGSIADYPNFPNEVTKADNVVDMTGYTLTPGLYNVHAHLGLTMPYLPYRFAVPGVPYRSLLMLRRACEALNCGITTIRSAGGPDDIDYAIRDAVEHAYHMEMDTACLMKERGSFLVATLSVTSCHDYLVGHGSPEFQVRKLDETGEAHSASIGNAIKAGVTICVGTDLLPSDPIDGTNATVREMELLVKAGLTPMQAIKAATSNSARLTDTIGFTGTLEAGKCGDFIAVKGKPDQNISDMRNLALVSKGCRLVWSEVPGMVLRRYNPVVPGMDLGGGTYIKW